VLADDSSLKEGSVRQRSRSSLHGRDPLGAQLVVNKVTKTDSDGYLSIPKAAVAASASTALLDSKRFSQE